jgi:hypothetical protein
MDRLQAFGFSLSALSVAGYAAGVLAAYPGRSFTITGLIVGLTLYAFGGVPDD